MNNAQGSKYLGPFYRRNNCHTTARMKAGDPFIMQVDPAFDCDAVTYDTIPKCNRFGQRQAGSENNGLFYPASEFATAMLIIPLGDTPPGSYSVQVAFAAGSVVTSVYIADNQGEQWAM